MSCFSGHGQGLSAMIGSTVAFVEGIFIASSKGNRIVKWPFPGPCRGQGIVSGFLMFWLDTVCSTGHGDSQC